MRQIFAYSGVLVQPDTGLGNVDLTSYALDLAPSRQRRPRLCYLATALGDADQAITATQGRFAARRPDVEFTALRLFPQPNVPDVRAHLLAQDVVLVEGGSVVNLLAVWRAHGLPQVLRECWDTGVVLSGPSAGSLCWHQGGPTDSFGDELSAVTDGLGLLPFSNGVHDDFAGQPRRAAYRSMIASGVLGAGYATEDGVGLHYVDRELAEVVTIRPGARAWQVEPSAGGGWQEKPLDARLLTPE